jgi:hypothetical protein
LIKKNGKREGSNKTRRIRKEVNQEKKSRRRQTVHFSSNNLVH